MIKLANSPSGTTFAVKVHPRAKKNAITGEVGDVLKVALTAPPVDGKANDACVEFFAKLLKVPRSSVTIAAGETSRNKVIRVAGLSEPEIRQRLAKLINFRFVELCSLMTQVHNTSEAVAAKLRRVKLLHTAIWAALAGAVLVLPIASWLDQFRWAFGLTLLILGECAVLALNGGRCPLTKVAARYTGNRSDNFDIYLPVWLARHNKRIFGALFVAGEFILLWRWTRRPGL